MKIQFKLIKNKDKEVLHEGIYIIKDIDEMNPIVEKVMDNIKQRGIKGKDCTMLMETWLD